MIEVHGSHQAHTSPAAGRLRNGNDAHELTREERARGGNMKAAKRRHRAEMADCADRIVWTLQRVGEEDAARVVQELFLPHTLVRPWESKRKSPLAKANVRIAELERLVEELLNDDAMALAIAGQLDAAEKMLDLALVTSRASGGKLCGTA